MQRYKSPAVPHYAAVERGKQEAEGNIGVVVVRCEWRRQDAAMMRGLAGTEQEHHACCSAAGLAKDAVRCV